MEKYLVYRITNHNGKKEYRRTKCLHLWTTERNECWQFSQQGAKGIVAGYDSHNRGNYYTYGYELA